MAGVIKTGVTSWAERSLLQSGFYPPEVKSAEARLRYYASRFPLVENDSGYWAVPEPDQTERWAQRTPPGFTMNMKANALMTGHYTDARRLPKDLRRTLPAALSDKEHLYPRDLSRDFLREIERRFHEALAPLARAGKLGVVLFQFPVWFPISHDNRRELIRIARRFQPYRVAIEFRNATWMSEDNREETLTLLAHLGLSYTCVDEPQGFPSSVPPFAACTADIALVRMHGRARDRWERGAESAAERFAYLYSEYELREWVPRIGALAERAREVHVLMNNCHSDYAVRNAAQMATLLGRDQPLATSGSWAD